jgi:hypothetical protein
MAGVKITIPGVGGQIEAKKKRIDAAVKWQWNAATAPPEKEIRRRSAGGFRQAAPNREADMTCRPTGRAVYVYWVRGYPTFNPIPYSHQYRSQRPLVL